MSIFTGQASRQAPQRVEAKGSSLACFSPTSVGVMMAPMGPGYTQPYACPPTFWYTGQMLRQAPQRRQLRTSRRHRVGQQACAPVVHQHKVELFGAVNVFVCLPGLRPCSRSWSASAR